MTSHNVPPEGNDPLASPPPDGWPDTLPAFPDALRRVVGILTTALADPGITAHVVAEHAEWLATDLMVLAEALAPDGRLVADDLGQVWWGDPEAEGSIRVADIARHDGERLTYRVVPAEGWRIVSANDLEALLSMAFVAVGQNTEPGAVSSIDAGALHRIRHTVLERQRDQPPWALHNADPSDLVVAAIEALRRDLHAFHQPAPVLTVPYGLWDNSNPDMVEVEALDLAAILHHAPKADLESPLGWAQARARRALLNVGRSAEEDPLADLPVPVVVDRHDLAAVIGWLIADHQPLDAHVAQAVESLHARLTSREA